MNNFYSRSFILYLFFLFYIQMVNAQWRAMHSPYMENVKLENLWISDPAVYTDTTTGTYYLTGTGGKLWKSKDLKFWDGPIDILRLDSASWTSKASNIWASEIHEYKGRYYYFTTFTDNNIIVDYVKGQSVPLRVCHVLTSNKPEGPYTLFGDDFFLPEDKPTIDATFFTDVDGKPYMIYCEEWLHNWNGTIEKIELKSDLSGTKGRRSVLFYASDSPWNGEYRNGRLIPSRVTDGPYAFRTDTGKLGIIWTSWKGDGKYTTGVAYSSDGTLNGTWIQEKDPIITPGYGHGMLFKNLEGKWMLSIHLHETLGNGSTRRTPHFFYVDLSGDKLVVGEEFK